MRVKLWAVAAVLFAAMSGSRLEAATLTVCASGCTYTSITTALAAAVNGDVITLKAGETYTGHWVLPNKGSMPLGITIRSDTSDANLPPAGSRINPTYNAFLPIVKSDSTSEPAFKAAYGADGYTLLGIRFQSSPLGFNEIIRFGGNVCIFGDECQEFESQEPTDMMVDRCVFEIDPITGQKIGVIMGGKRLTVKNSYMAGFAAIGQDSYAIGGSNGHGPVTITNNYMEASTETFLFGGDDPRIRTIMTVTGTPTTSSASVNVSVGSISLVAHNLSELSVGQHIAVLVQGGTQRAHTIIRSITGSGTTGSITFDPIPNVPDVPGDIRTGVQFDGVTITRNHSTKPLRWMDPIVRPATLATATASTSSGTLPAATYVYTVVAYNTNSYAGNDAFSNPITTNSAVLSATGKVTVSWTGTPDATHYRVYGRTGTVTNYWTVTAPTTTFDDTGAAGTAATSVVKATYWQVKNLGEIKAASNVLMSGNVFEYGWSGSDIGYTGLWIKTVNQGGGGEGLWSKDIVVENNIFRHINGVFLLSGQEIAGLTNADKPGPLTNYTFRNNLIYDCGSAWSISKGAAVTSAYPFIVSNHTVNTKIDHNTINCTSRGFLWLDGTVPHDNLIVTNNMGLKNTNGVGASGLGQGTAALEGKTSSYTFTNNAIGGIALSSYPPGNFGPSVPTWQAEFNNYTASGADDADGPADYTLRDDSTYIAAGTDGLPLGANLTAVFTATNGVVEGATVPVNFPPTITTTSPLPQGTVGTAYSTTLSANGTGTLTWAVQSGSLPTSLSLSSAGVISGTPTVAQTQTFTVRVTDAATSLTADQVLALTINSSYTAPTITTTTLTNATVSVPYTATLVRTAGLAPFVWSVSAGALPPGVTLNATTGVLSGTPSATGPFNFTALVTDALNGTDTQALTLTVAAVVLPCGRPAKFQGQEIFTFKRPTAPVVTPPDCAALNDFWIDTSTNPAVVKLIISTTGGVVQTTSVGSIVSADLMSSAHSDTVAATPTEGAIIVGTENSKWSVLTPGPPGTVLASDGNSISYVQPTIRERGTSLTFHTRSGSAPTTWTDMPLATSGFLGSVNQNTIPFVVTDYTKVQLYVRSVTPAVTGATMWLEYGLDPAGSVWTPIDGPNGTGTSVLIDTNGHQVSQPANIVQGLTGLIYLRISAKGGNGTTDPTFGNIVAVFW